MILCETEIFSIDENWLPQPPPLTLESKQQVELPRRLLGQEKDMIEAALKDTRGRVSGPHGGRGQVRYTAVYSGIEDSVVKDEQESIQDFSCNWRAPDSHKLVLNMANIFQVGRLSFFKSAANRGSLCKLFSSGSTFVKIKLSSCLA